MAARIGHRGAAGTAPENTLISFRRAAALRCDGVEFDLHRTADGHLVVIHDERLDRTTTGHGLVRSATLAGIRTLDAGQWKGPEFGGERVPTLAEVVLDPDLQGLFLHMEMKAGSLHYAGIEEQLVQELRELGCLHRVRVSSFDHVGLKQLHDLAPELPLGMLYDCNPLDPVGMAQAIGATALHPAWYFVTPQLVQAAHAAGLQVNVWTVNCPEVLAHVRNCGVDGIMSDFPDML